MSFFRELRTKADQVSLEADKRLRISRKRAEISQHRKSISELITQLGNTAYGLYKQGQPLAPELAQVCQQIDSLYADIQVLEQESEHIRQEALQVEPLAPVTRCHACGAALPEAAVFCPHCGHTQPEPAVGIICPNCGASLPADARFCAECGTPVVIAKPEPEEIEAVPPSEPPLIVLCSSCQAEIPPEATFCPVCGNPVTSEPAMEETVVEEAAPDGTEP